MQYTKKLVNALQETNKLKERQHQKEKILLDIKITIQRYEIDINRILTEEQKTIATRDLAQEYLKHSFNPLLSSILKQIVEGCDGVPQKSLGGGITP